ncbi:hypothetical protein J27TS7_35130 [Paenibacillus dendritiformis]|nr:hypothetical protein J27TS7_35130 [Paenibacillus dendritiformis]
MVIGDFGRDEAAKTVDAPENETANNDNDSTDIATIFFTVIKQRSIRTIQFKNIKNKDCHSFRKMQ